MCPVLLSCLKTEQCVWYCRLKNAFELQKHAWPQHWHNHVTPTGQPKMFLKHDRELYDMLKEHKKGAADHKPASTIALGEFSLYCFTKCHNACHAIARLPVVIALFRTSPLGVQWIFACRNNNAD